MNSKLFPQINNYSYIFPKGFPITRKQLKWEASKYTQVAESTDGWQPGNKWYKGFIDRNPEIKQSIKTTKSRMPTESDIRYWYQKVHL